MRMALLDEVTRLDQLITGTRFNHLLAFVSLLSQVFITFSIHFGLKDKQNESWLTKKKHFQTEKE
jgi:thiamine pyrophosphokinase